MEKQRYKNQPRNFFESVKHLARSAMHNMTTHELSTHGRHTFPKNHLDKRVALPMPTHFDEEVLFPEFYGEVVDQHLGPLMYDRQGHAVTADDIEFMRTESDIV